jgi:hypothetical protein
MGRMRQQVCVPWLSDFFLLVLSVLFAQVSEDESAELPYELLGTTAAYKVNSLP